MPGGLLIVVQSLFETIRELPVSAMCHGRWQAEKLAGIFPSRHSSALSYEVLRPFPECPMLVCLQLLHTEAMATS